MRSYTTQEEAAINAPHGVGAWLVDIGWSSPATAYRATTFGRTIRWNGYDWRGMGDLVAAEAIKETTGFIVTQYRLTLPAFSREALTQALLPTKGTPVRIWEAHLDPDTGDVVPNPHLGDEGEIDRCRITIRRDTAAITAYIQSENADYRRRRVQRWTDADHRAKYPNDTGMRYVATVPQTTLIWPSREAQL